MTSHDLYDAGFTEGYSHGIDGKPRRLGAPIELVLLRPKEIVHWRNAYEQGFAKAKADRYALQQSRDAQRAAERASEDRDLRDER